MRVFDWEEGRRDTSIATSRVIALRNEGFPVPCVWSAQKVRALHIDHCFPWARWLNNDLWNLLPASAAVNSSKFLLEAGSSLPKLVDGELGVGDIYLALLHQRARLKADQQLVEWSL